MAEKLLCGRAFCESNGFWDYYYSYQNSGYFEVILRYAGIISE